MGQIPSDVQPHPVSVFAIARNREQIVLKNQFDGQKPSNELDPALDVETVGGPILRIILPVVSQPVDQRQELIDLISIPHVSIEPPDPAIVEPSLVPITRQLRRRVQRMGGSAITQDQSTSLCKTMPKMAYERAEGSVCVADKNIAATLHKIHEINSVNISELTG